MTTTHGTEGEAVNYRIKRTFLHQGRTILTMLAPRPVEDGVCLQLKAHLLR